MFTSVAVDLQFRPTSPATADEISDLIEDLVDALDGWDPSVRSVGLGESFSVTVEVVVENDDPIDALTKGLALIRGALQETGAVRTALQPTASVRELQPA